MTPSKLILLAILVCTALPSPRARAQPLVRLGDEQVFESPYAEIFKGKRVAILAHNASRLRNGTHVVDALYRQSRTEIVSGRAVKKKVPPIENDFFT